MAKEDLIDQHVSVKQCKMAVDALLKHVTKVQEKQQEFELLGGREQHVWLTIAVKQMQPEKKLKPHRIPIVHPLVDPRTSSICLITKDPQREYKDLLEKKGVKFVSRVVGIEKLKGKFKPFEARRLLLKENDLFLADARVIPLLPGLLGKKFFDAKKQPIPVDLTKKDLKAELEKAISSTYFHQNQGTCASIKVGTLSQTPAQIIANIKSALPAVVKVIKDGWNNVQNLHIKTSSSASLPIWTCDLGSGEGGRWDGLDADVEMSGSDSEEQSEEEADEDMDDAEEKIELKTGKKGKKRVAEDKEEEEKPKKKARVKGTSEKVAQPPVTPTPSKKKKAHESSEKPATSVRSTPSVTVEQVKQKKSTTAIEKKKEKVGKAKKSGGESAKEALIGKKGLQH
ncbi:ribosomal protein L1p/L10e family-domain-containing protein [Abortiporus biennis]|nr:ribosomal protein L1p/L10e family-domain-containing protein [Abortiporus biennis]